MKDELGKIMTKYVELQAKTYRYLIEDTSEDKKAKLKFENHNCLEATQHENKIQHLKKIKFTQIVLKKIIKNS